MDDAINAGIPVDSTAETHLSDQTTTIARMRDLLARFVGARQWEKYHDAKNLAMSLAIEAAELMEHFQWVRNDELDRVQADAALMAKVRDEVADVLAYTLGLANVLKIDLSAAYEAKMAKNETKYPADVYRGWYAKPEADRSAGNRTAESGNPRE